MFFKKGWQIINNLKLLLALCLSSIFVQVSTGQVHVVVDQIGYDIQAPKQALVVATAQDRLKQFVLIDVLKHFLVHGDLETVVLAVLVDQRPGQEGLKNSRHIRRRFAGLRKRYFLTLRG